MPALPATDALRFRQPAPSNGLPLGLLALGGLGLCASLRRLAVQKERGWGAAGLGGIRVRDRRRAPRRRSRPRSGSRLMISLLHRRPARDGRSSAASPGSGARFGGACSTGRIRPPESLRRTDRARDRSDLRARPDDRRPRSPGSVRGVVLVGRDALRLEAVRAEIATAHGADRVVAVVADMSSIRSVGEAVEENRRPGKPTRRRGRQRRRDVPGAQRGTDGIEATLATMVVGPFALIAGLLPLLRGTGHARVVAVTSGGMYAQPLDLDDLRGPAGRGAERGPTPRRSAPRSRSSASGPGACHLTRSRSARCIRVGRQPLGSQRRSPASAGSWDRCCGHPTRGPIPRSGWPLTRGSWGETGACSSTGAPGRSTEPHRPA